MENHSKKKKIIYKDIILKISLTYLFRIKTKDKYLVKNARGIDKF